MQKFRKTNIQQKIKSYKNFKDILTDISPKTLVKLSVIIFCIVLLFIFGSWIVRISANVGSFVGKKAVVTVSNIAGKEMQRDKFGHINILLVGIGGKNHAGGTLADTIIVASFDTNNNTVSMVSIPRDLYIYEKGKYANKINAVFAFTYAESQGDYDTASSVLSAKIGEILGMDIPYYAVIDFNGFEKVVDTIGGIEVDVPYMIYDREFPGPNNTYEIFTIEPGLQKLDGETALKYARSRHSTSDFSRSQRQQFIIKAILTQALKTQNIINPSTLSSLYDQYIKMVFTNIKSDEIIGLAKYSVSMPQIFSFGLTMECNDMAYRTMEAGCLLVPGNQDDYNGMSVLVPTKNGYDSKLDFYDRTKFFGYMVLQDNTFLLDKANIAVYNAVDPNVGKKYRYRNGFAGKVASKLIRYGFQIGDAGNANQNIDQTVLVINGTGNYYNTIRILKLFVDLPIIKKKEDLLSNIGPENVNTGDVRSNLEIYLGSDFVAKYGNTNYDLYSQ